MRKKEGFLLREVADEALLVHVGARVVETNALVHLKETSRWIWERISPEPPRPAGGGGAGLQDEMQAGTRSDRSGADGVLRVSGTEVLPLLREVLGSGARVRLAVTGASMRPFIRSGEVVEMESPPGWVPAVGEVVFAAAGDGRNLLHRVVAAGPEGIFTRGDAHRAAEGPFAAAQIVARATVVVKRGRVRPLAGGVPGLLARAWSFSTAGP